MAGERPPDPVGRPPESPGRSLPRGDAEAPTAAPGELTAPAESTAVEAPARQPTPLTQQIGRITVIALAALFLVFALVNLQPVTFSWIFGKSIAVTTPAGNTSGGVPLILLLIASFVMGGVVGAGLTWRRERVRRRQRTSPRV